jgi:ankyrin repeat protein
MNKEESNEKIIKLMYNNSLDEKEIELFKELIYQCDLTIQNKYGWTPVIFALTYNQKQNLNLTTEQCNYLFQNSDLSQKDNYGCNPLMYAFSYNKSNNLNLSKEQWNYLIQHSDLQQQDKDGWIPLMFALKYHQSENLHLTTEQIDYLIQHSDLNQEDNIGWTPLMYALIYQQSQNLNLAIQHFQMMYESLSEEQQQNTFQHLIAQNNGKNKKYLGEINLFLYDLKFNPNKKIIKWLQRNSLQDILQIIEKRYILLKLNKDIKPMDNHQKVSIIKI